MQYITDPAEIEKMILPYLLKAANEATQSNCQKSKRGAVIVSHPLILGSGYNYSVDQSTCCLRKDIRRGIRSELCNGVHAEQRAIDDAISQNQDIRGARLYHIELENGEMVPSGFPSCPICSKEVLEHKIKDVVRWHKQGYAIYQALEFHRLSIKYHQDLKVKIITL